MSFSCCCKQRRVVSLKLVSATRHPSVGRSVVSRAGRAGGTLRLKQPTKRILRVVSQQIAVRLGRDQTFSGRRRSKRRWEWRTRREKKKTHTNSQFKWRWRLTIFHTNKQRTDDNDDDARALARENKSKQKRHLTRQHCKDLITHLHARTHERTKGRKERAMNSSALWTKTTDRSINPSDDTTWGLLFKNIPRLLNSRERVDTVWHLLSCCWWRREEVVRQNHDTAGQSRAEKPTGLLLNGGTGSGVAQQTDC